MRLSVKDRRITVLGVGILIACISFSSSSRAATQTGIASVYSGEPTANGEYAHASALTAAHRTLPIGTTVEVTTLPPRRSVVARLNDRRPSNGGRIPALAPAGAGAIGSPALAPVTLPVLSA